MTPETGACEILDKEAQVVWHSPTNHPRFGWVRLNLHEEPLRVELRNCAVSVNGTDLTASFLPFPSRRLTRFTVIARALSDERTLELAYQEDDELQIESVSLLDDVFAISESDHGYALVPVREGLLVPADSGKAFTHRFDTYAYEGCHMTMLGAVKEGAAAMFSWSDPYVAADLKSTLDAANHQRLAPSLVLSKSARTFRISFLGKGDYVTVANAYRKVAEAKGERVTWPQKLKDNPTRAKLFGAANFKLWSVLDRRMNAESTKEESVRVNWTFDEAAQVAEHLKRDLKLEKVLFTMGGWIHRGYDNQHPDILPTAPECGGDAAFADCARRVLNLGYLFCLHDNYQDIYRDSPSWDEKLLMKAESGKPARGGHWAGGQAYLICSQEALGLAERPQNLRGVKKLSSANAYFIDTTYAAGLQECYDSAHPLTRGDDMVWKQRLSDYARQVFGVFGSECGREWAIPHSDFFEGLTGVSGHAYHDAKLEEKLGATVVPLFDLVYRDCIAMYGKYGYNPRQAGEYVLRHISLARPLNYHSVPPHLYWKNPAKEEAAATAAAALFTRADHGWAEGLHPFDRFLKNTQEVLSPLNELTAQLPMTGHRFLTSDRNVQETTFGDGTARMTITINTSGTNYLCASKSGEPVLLPPYGFLAESDTFVAFHALNWQGLKYDDAPLFTLRSMDGLPLRRSKQIRVFHGFGDPRLRIGPKTHEVTKETILAAAD